MLILIDNSYLIFYRYHATRTWMSMAHKDVYKEYKEDERWIECDIFREKYHKMYIDTLGKIAKKYGVVGKKKANISDLWLIQDSTREDLWRKKIYSKYKDNRDKIYNKFGENAGPCPFFKYTYQDLVPKINIKHVQVPSAEADDVIAVISKYVDKRVDKRVNKRVDKRVLIIASDTDYCQLNPNRISIISLKGFKPVIGPDNMTHKEYLTAKILQGDSSDNIPGCFTGCGKKTAEKLAKDPEALKEVLKDDNIRQTYERNKTLISFDCIPEDIQNRIISVYLNKTKRKIKFIINFAEQN